MVKRYGWRKKIKEKDHQIAILAMLHEPCEEVWALTVFAMCRCKISNNLRIRTQILLHKGICTYARIRTQS